MKVAQEIHDATLMKEGGAAAPVKHANKSEPHPDIWKKFMMLTEDVSDVQTGVITITKASALDANAHANRGCSRIAMLLVVSLLWALECVLVHCWCEEDQDG